MTAKLKTVVATGIAILVIALVTFLITYYLIGLSLPDAMYWAIFIPLIEFAARGLVQLYTSAKNRIQK